MPKIERSYTRCRYGQVHYLEGVPERATAPTLILLHQNPSSSQEYEKLVAEMASDRRVIAFDTPGYGMSDPPPAPLSMIDYAASFADAIEAMALPGPIDVYGYHTGTLLAAELGIALPRKVARLAMTGIPMFDAEALASRLQEARAVPPPTEDGAAILARLAALWDYVVMQRDPGVTVDRAARAFADKGRTLDRFAWAYQGVWSYDFDRLRQIPQPVLLIQPHETLREVSLRAAATIPNATIVECGELDRDIFEVGVPQIAAAMRAFFTP